MAADGNSSDNEINDINQEPLPEDMSYIFAPDELFESSDSIFAYNHLAKLLVRNDAATILKELEASFPRIR